MWEKYRAEAFDEGTSVGLLDVVMGIGEGIFDLSCVPSVDLGVGRVPKTTNEEVVRGELTISIHVAAGDGPLDRDTDL
jgi:hypothetical protein